MVPYVIVLSASVVLILTLEATGFLILLHTHCKNQVTNGILLPKLFLPTVRKDCSSDRVKLLKFEAEGREFAKFSRSLGQFIQTVKDQSAFSTCYLRFMTSNELEQL